MLIAIFACQKTWGIRLKTLLDQELLTFKLFSGNESVSQMTEKVRRAVTATGQNPDAILLETKDITPDIKLLAQTLSKTWPVLVFGGSSDEDFDCSSNPGYYTRTAFDGTRANLTSALEVFMMKARVMRSLKAVVAS